MVPVIPKVTDPPRPGIPHVPTSGELRILRERVGRAAVLVDEQVRAVTVLKGLAARLLPDPVAERLERHWHRAVRWGDDVLDEASDVAEEFLAGFSYGAQHTLRHVYQVASGGPAVTPAAISLTAPRPTEAGGQPAGASPAPVARNAASRSADER